MLCEIAAMMMASNSDMLSVVVLNYNGIGVLEKCLSSVTNTSYSNLEIIVVDNGSTDNSPDIAERFAKSDSRVKVVKNASNLGFVGGNNVGAAASKGKYIVLLNNDTEVLPNWLEEPTRLMDSDQKIGLCEGKILTPDGRVSYPGSFNPLGGLRRDAESDTGQYDYVHEIFSPIGVAPIVRRNLIERIGLFDPEIWWVGDVEDLSWRIHLHGYKVMYSPKCVIYHLARLGHKWYPRRMRMEVAFHATKNSYLMMLKNASWNTIVKYLPLMVVMRFGELLYLSSANKSDIFVVKIRAHFWVLKHLKHIWRLRTEIQDQMRNISDAELFKIMCRPYISQTVTAYRRLVRSL
jgi:GT2 family glycosyltransferase